MTDVELAWLAGYLEGEGCFTMAGTNRKRRGNVRHFGTPSILVAATDKDVIHKAARLIGDKHVYSAKPPRTNLMGGMLKQQWRTSVHGKDAVRLMERLLPFMGSRRSDRIRYVLEQVSLRPGHAHGERITNSKLTAEAVRASRASSDSVAVLAARNGVTALTMRRAISGQTWARV